MIYIQNLYNVVDDHIKPHIVKRKNRYNQWDYGYNKEYDVVVISKTGKIGEIYEIQNLKIALPLAEKVYKRSKKTNEQFWEVKKLPEELKKIQTVFDWNQYPQGFKDKWYDYINQ